MRRLNKPFIILDLINIGLWILVIWAAKHVW